MEFSKLLKTFSFPADRREDDYRLITDRVGFEGLVRSLRKPERSSSTWNLPPFDPMRAEIVGLSFSFQSIRRFIFRSVMITRAPPINSPGKEVLGVLRPLLEDPG